MAHAGMVWYIPSRSSLDAWLQARLGGLQALVDASVRRLGVPERSVCRSARCAGGLPPRCAARGGRRRGRRATPDRLFKRFFAPGSALYAALVGVAFARTVGLGKQLWYKTPEQGLPALARARPLKALREPHTGRFCPDGARSLQDPLALSLPVAPTQVSRPRSPGLGSGRSPRSRPLSVLEFQVVCECTQK